jgi:hypothetical protein
MHPRCRQSVYEGNGFVGRQRRSEQHGREHVVYVGNGPGTRLAGFSARKNRRAAPDSALGRNCASDQGMAGDPARAEKPGGHPTGFPYQAAAALVSAGPLRGRREGSTSDKGIDNPVSKSVRVLLDNLDIDGKRNFLALRHTFRTIGRGAKDREAIDALIGRVDETMASHYIEDGLSDERLLLEFTRGHWAIENGLHYRRDVTLGEDASRIRKGGAPQVMAALRNGTIHVLSDVAAPSLASAVGCMGNCLSKPLEILGLPQLE